MNANSTSNQCFDDLSIKCHNAILEHLSNLPSFKGDILQITKSIIFRVFSQKYSNKFEIIERITEEYIKLALPFIAQPNTKTLRRKSPYLSELICKIKSLMLTDEEILEEAGFSQDSIPLILNESVSDLREMLRNQNKITKLSTQEREKRVFALDQILKHKQPENNENALFSSSFFDEQNNINIKPTSGVLNTNTIESNSYKDDLNAVAKEFEMSDELVNDIEKTIDIALKNGIFKVDFIPTILTKAIPKIYKGVILSFYGKKIADFLTKIKELIVRDLAVYQANFKALIQSAKVGTTIIAEVKNFMEFGASKKQVRTSLNV